MSNLRADLRRTARARQKMPVIPGVMPDRTQPSIDRAMAQAHADLPPLPHSQVTLHMWPADEGLRVLADSVYADRPEAIKVLRQKIRQIGGTDPTIVVATRTLRPNERHT